MKLVPLQHVLCPLLNPGSIKMPPLNQTLRLVAEGLDLRIVNLDISLHSLVFLEKELDTRQVMAKVLKRHQCFNFIHPYLEIQISFITPFEYIASFFIDHFQLTPEKSRNLCTENQWMDSGCRYNKSCDGTVMNYNRQQKC